jgi:molybdenum cofactor cytidylyltransferase
LGKAAARIRRHIRDWQTDIWVNPDPDRGQLSSIQLALSHIPVEANACLIWPVDQPAVSEELVRELTRLFVASESLIACPVYGDKRGHPAIFHRALFREFMDASLEEGPKQILLRHQQVTAPLPTRESAVVLDIDTPSEYESLTGESLSSALASRGISPENQKKFVIRKTGRSEV